MLRKGIQVATGIRNADIKLLRTDEGRPYMDGLQGLDLNVSHHGDFVSNKPCAFLICLITFHHSL